MHDARCESLATASKLAVRTGSLTVVGSGIQAGRDMTRGARDCIRRADKVLYLASDPITALWLHRCNQSAESLHTFYDTRISRRKTYAAMARHVLKFVCKGLDVCVVCYGHPGIFSLPMHETIRSARAAGYSAAMLPAISSIDWLYADLGVDPGTSGCQIFEASYFLGRRPAFNPHSVLILLQVGFIGEEALPKDGSLQGFRQLANLLTRTYGAGYEVILYEASVFPIGNPSVQRLRLGHVSTAKLSLSSTLFVPAMPEQRQPARRASEYLKHRSDRHEPRRRSRR